MKVSTQTTQPPNVHNYAVTVNITAEAVERRDDGTFDIVLSARPLTSDEQHLLSRLFPHTQEEVHMLLQRELLIGSITDNR